VRIYHAKSYKEELEERSKYTAKLTHLKRNTSGLDLVNVLKHHKAKTCFIPRNPKTYQRVPYAYVSFSSLEDLEEALIYDIPMTLDSYRIYWVDEDHQSCNRCGHPDHLIKDCPNIQFRRTNEKRINRLANIITKKRLDDPEALRILNKVRTATVRKQKEEKNNKPRTSSHKEVAVAAAALPNPRKSSGIESSMHNPEKQGKPFKDN